MRKLELLACACFLVACGTKDKKNDLVKTLSGLAAMGSDSALQVQVLDLQASEALEAAGGGEDMKSSVGLLLTDVTTSKDLPVKSCVAEAGKAVVTLTHEFEHSKTMDKTNMSGTQKMAASGSQTRTWSKTGQTFVCEGNHAKIDWSDATLVTGLKLDIEAAKSRTMENNMVNKKNGKTKVTSNSMTMTATRNIEWLSETTTGTEVTRKKQVISKATRTMTMKKASGEEVKAEFNVATKEASPLVIEVVRVADVQTSKNIISGTVVATLKDDGKMETTFDNLKFDATDAGDCTAASGTFATAFYDKASLLLKTINCTAADGAVTCKDAVSGEETDPIAPQCDPTDAK